MIKDIKFYLQSHGPSGTDQSRSSAFSRSRATQARNTKIDNIKLQSYYRSGCSIKERFVFSTRSTSIKSIIRWHREIRNTRRGLPLLLFLLLLSKRSVQRIPYRTVRDRRQGKKCWRSVHFVLIIAPNLAVLVVDTIDDRARRIIQNGWTKSAHLSQTGDKSPAEV